MDVNNVSFVNVESVRKNSKSKIGSPTRMLCICIDTNKSLKNNLQTNVKKHIIINIYALFIYYYKLTSNKHVTY